MNRDFFGYLRVLGLLGVAAGVALSTAACGDEASERYPTPDSFCTAKSTEECSQASMLCGVTNDACMTRRESICTDGANAAQAAGRVYRAPAAEKCITDTKALYADRVVDKNKEAAALETCERVFAGTKKSGEPCTQAFECESPLMCDRGFCAAKVMRTQDQPCNNPGDVCATGTYCGPRSGSNFCVPRVALSGDCNAAMPCLETLRCAVRCVEKLGPGQPCDVADDCTTGYCDASRKCAAKQLPGSGRCTDFGG